MRSLSSDFILNRMMDLHPKVIDLTLDRVWSLLESLGNPQNNLPKVIHIAGTNGKGSTLSMLRAGLNEIGLKTHAYTSPHLVRFHERIQLHDNFIDENALTEILDECYLANKNRPITYFEITTCAAILAMSRKKADYVLLEVGLGGMLDATNVIARPALTIITPVSLDHEQFLGNTIKQIAGEKAGIIKPFCPVVIGKQNKDALEVITEKAFEQKAPILAEGREWHIKEAANSILYKDENKMMELPKPNLLGTHQVQNAGMAIAALTHLIEKKEAFYEQISKEQNKDIHSVPQIYINNRYIGGHDELFSPTSREDSDIFNRFLLNGYEFVQTWEGFVYHMTCRGSRFADGAKRNPDGQVFMKGRETEEWLKQNGWDKG